MHQYDESQPYIFISYSSRDGETVRKDVEELNRRGVNIWYDEELNKAIGEKWDDKVLLSMKNPRCKACFFYVSEYSITSNPCRKELFYTKSEVVKKTHAKKAIPIYPIELENIIDISEWIQVDMVDKYYTTEEADEENDLLPAHENAIAIGDEFFPDNSVKRFKFSTVHDDNFYEQLFFSISEQLPEVINQPVRMNEEEEKLRQKMEKERLEQQEQALIEQAKVEAEAEAEAIRAAAEEEAQKLKEQLLNEAKEQANSVLKAAQTEAEKVKQEVEKAKQQAENAKQQVEDANKKIETKEIEQEEPVQKKPVQKKPVQKKPAQKKAPAVSEDELMTKLAENMYQMLFDAGEKVYRIADIPKDILESAKKGYFKDENWKEALVFVDSTKYKENKEEKWTDGELFCRDKVIIGTDNYTGEKYSLQNIMAIVPLTKHKFQIVEDNYHLVHALGGLTQNEWDALNLLFDTYYELHHGKKPPVIEPGKLFPKPDLSRLGSSHKEAMDILFADLKKQYPDCVCYYSGADIPDRLWSKACKKYIEWKAERSDVLFLADKDGKGKSGMVLTKDFIGGRFGLFDYFKGYHFDTTVAYDHYTYNQEYSNYYGLLMTKDGILQEDLWFEKKVIVKNYIDIRAYVLEKCK